MSENSNKNIFKAYTNAPNLYLIQLAGGSALFKLLNYEQGRIVERICTEFPSLTARIEEDIWEECIVEHSFPAKEHMNAGIISTVVRIILKLSTPSSVEEMQADLNKEREKLKDVRDQIVIKVCEAFPGYTPDEVYQMDWPTLIQRLSQAEKILGIELNITNEQQSKAKSVMPTANVAMKAGNDGNHYIDFDKENASLRDL